MTLKELISLLTNEIALETELDSLVQSDNVMIITQTWKDKNGEDNVFFIVRPKTSNGPSKPGPITMDDDVIEGVVIN